MHHPAAEPLQPLSPSPDSGEGLQMPSAVQHVLAIHRALDAQQEALRAVHDPRMVHDGRAYSQAGVLAVFDAGGELPRMAHMHAVAAEKGRKLPKHMTPAIFNMLARTALSFQAQLAPNVYDREEAAYVLGTMDLQPDLPGNRTSRFGRHDYFTPSVAPAPPMPKHRASRSRDHMVTRGHVTARAAARVRA